MQRLKRKEARPIGKEDTRLNKYPERPYGVARRLIWRCSWDEELIRKLSEITGLNRQSLKVYVLQMACAIYEVPLEMVGGL